MNHQNQNHTTVPETFGGWDQDALREAMQVDRDVQVSTSASKHGPDGLRAELVALFRKRGQLTVGDLATLTGRSEDAARALVRSYSAKGVIDRVQDIHGIGIFALAEGYE